MKISHVEISNILGITSLNFAPGEVTVIAGENGSGKTSILEALKSALGTGHDATLLRQGETEGEVVLVLDDGSQIRRRITEGKSATTFSDPDGKQMKTPAAAIKALTDALSVNPVDFLTAKKADRVQVLLESMPIELDYKKLSAISGVTVAPGGSALVTLDHVRKQVFDDRTGTNRAIKEKDNTINQLRLAMPEAPAGVEGDEDSILEQIEAARLTRDAETKRIDTKLGTVRTASQSVIDAIRAKAQADVDKIKADGQAEIDAERTRVAAIEVNANTMLQRAATAYADAVAPLEQAQAVIRANRDGIARREQALITVQQMQKQHDDLLEDAETMTAAITAIDQYKRDLLAALPIPNIEVKDGDIYRNGIIFDRLNTAEQVKIAVEIAKLRAGDLAVVCVDQIEVLDPKTFDEFCKQFGEAGLQLFVTRVTGDKFNIHTA